MLCIPPKTLPIVFVLFDRGQIDSTDAVQLVLYLVCFLDFVVGGRCAQVKIMDQFDERCLVAFFELLGQARETLEVREEHRCLARLALARQ